MAKSENEYKRSAVIKLINALDIFEITAKKLEEIGLEFDTVYVDDKKTPNIEGDIWSALEDLSVFNRWEEVTDIIGGIRSLNISAEDRADMILGIKETPEEIIREAHA